MHCTVLLLCVTQAELEQMMEEYTALRTRYDQAEQQRASLRLALTDAQAAAADAAVEVRAANAKAERLQQELDLVRSESVSQASSLRSQATAREERLAAQHTCRLAQLQSELDAQAAAAADSEAALAAARKQVEQFAGQVGHQAQHEHRSMYAALEPLLAGGLRLQQSSPETVRSCVDHCLLLPDVISSAGCHQHLQVALPGPFKS